MSEEIGDTGIEMKEISIYFYSTIKGGRIQNGAYSYLLEMQTEKGPVTLSKAEKVFFMTAHKSELIALAAALKRIQKSSRLVIYTDSGYVAANVRDRLVFWNKNGWKTAKGKPVKHQKEWQEIYQLLVGHAFKFVISTEHGYYLWMKREAEEKSRCM